MAKASSITCIEPLLLADYPVLDTYAETLVQDKHDVSFVRIDREDGSVVAEAPRGGSEDPELLRECRVYCCDVTVAADDPTVLGRVTVGISTRHPDARIAAHLRALAVGITLSFVFLAVIFAGVVRRVIGRPLGQLDAHASGAGQGDLDAPI